MILCRVGLMDILVAPNVGCKRRDVTRVREESLGIDDPFSHVSQPFWKRLPASSLSIDA